MGTWHLIFFSILIYNFVCAIYIYRLDQKQVTVLSFAWFLRPKLKYAYIHNNWVYPIPFARRCCASMFRCAIHPSGPACVRPRWLITRNVLQASSGEGLTPHTFHHYLFGPLQAPPPLSVEGIGNNCDCFLRQELIQISTLKYLWFSRSDLPKWSLGEINACLFWWDPL